MATNHVTISDNKIFFKNVNEYIINITISDIEEGRFNTEEKIKKEINEKTEEYTSQLDKESKQYGRAWFTSFILFILLISGVFFFTDEAPFLLSVPFIILLSFFLIKNENTVNNKNKLITTINDINSQMEIEDDIKNLDKLAECKAKNNKVSNYLSNIDEIKKFHSQAIFKYIELEHLKTVRESLKK